MRILKAGIETDESRRFGTFGGVFTPSTLTILGVIMYLRLGWVVGNAGFLGALFIILLANAVTICTGLSLSSMTTNIRIGTGGAYSVISRSLGLEAGGSIGIPLYIAQTLSAALYIIGFTEGWRWIFPDHPPRIVSSVVWMSLLAISYISTNLAIRAQYAIMTIIGISLVSIAFTRSAPVRDFILLGDFQVSDFWRTFAIFFPAVTGIMAGANMSGDLKNPRRAIPVGTMGAIGVTLVIYIGLAYLAARYVSPEELRSSQMVLVDMSLWRPAVIAGILGATFSSALGSMLGAPRILQALAQQKTVPYHSVFRRTTKANEPRNALVVTGIAIEISLLAGNLDSLATLITLFFLITYATLNLIVFLQQSMKIISFRPTFKIPRFVPFLGAIGCVGVMFLINPAFSVVAGLAVISLYAWLTRKGLEAEWGDIRGGFFLVLAERATRLSAKFPRHYITWKPDLLVPIDDPEIWAGPLLFIRNITHPSGSIFAFTVREEHPEEIQMALDDLLAPMKKEGILVNSTVIEDRDFLHGTRLVIQTLKGRSFRPNILFMTIGDDRTKDPIIEQITDQAVRYELGLAILRQHGRKAFGMQRDVNIWLRDRSPNWHLALLISLQIQLNWEGKINLLTATEDSGEKKRLREFLEHLADQARLPSQTYFHVLIGPFENTLGMAPKADINIFGLAGNTMPFEFIRKSAEVSKTSCLFVRDSGHESALV